MKRTLNNRAFLNIAASSLIVGVTMVGCSGAAMQAHPSIASAKTGKQAAVYASKAEVALHQRNVATALSAAEIAVAAQPDNAAYRALLGRAYLADGRFISAETAFSDAMTLGNGDARTIVSLALAKVALGEASAARSLLSSHMDRLPAADYGLAVAIAGDAQEGVRILSQAAQDPGADAKTRQNFAYALALAGNWKDARIMAGQDLDPATATQRIIGWAQTADQNQGAQRVAALVGTNIRLDDAGLPSRLALAAPAATPMLAEAPAAPDVKSEAAPVQVAVAVPIEKPTITPPVEAPRQPVLAQAPRIVRDAMKPVLRQIALLKPVDAAASSQWVVQLGAYDSAAVAKDGWQRMTRAHLGLARYAALNSSATVNGRLYYRLAVKGFADRVSAANLCRSIRARGSACFVRAGTPDAKPLNWAAASKRQQFASR